MNSLRSIVLVFVRGYARQPRRHMKYSKYQPKSETPMENEFCPDMNEDNFDYEENHVDYDSAESDFASAGQSYKEYTREEYRAKELLKLRMVSRKYFKSTDPNFITWSEKHQIQTLHSKNNVEWSPEKLSEAFPALPGTIRKILKSKWAPKSVDTVIKHDLGVIENWKKFKTGSLAVNPKLEDHLQKFKNRKMEIENLASNAEEFVKKPPVFPTPKCNLFSSVVKNYIQQPNKKETLQITDKKHKNDEIPAELTEADKNSNEQLVTFKEFLKNKVDEVAGDTNISLENQLLIDEYKNQMNTSTLNDKDVVTSKSDENKSSTSIITNKFLPTLKEIPKFHVDEDSIDTGIIEWEKNELSCLQDYPNFIKVPRAKAKPGITFRVQDCYYDSDGEFLYRVPGLKT